MNKYAIKSSISSKELKSLRKSNKLSRKDLASLLNVSIRTVEGWERSDKEISGPIVLLYKMILEYPEYIDSLIVPKQNFPLRLLYKCNNDINTIIDVDMLNRKVVFKNFTNNLLLRAFGNKEYVTYDDYESFLESRCFPKTRDNIKIQLDMLGVPFYDPLLIIEKTQGRVAEDSCYIEIIRGSGND